MRRVITRTLAANILVFMLFTMVHPIAAKADGVLNPAIDQIVQQVLLNIRDHGWNPQAQMRGVTTGGLYINWQMDNPAVTNAGNTAISHDPQVDLYYLNALAEYQTLHPQDHTYNAELQHALQQVEIDYQNYDLPKGGVYFYLLRDGFLLQNGTLISDAYTAAANYYAHWYDPHAGIVDNHAHSPADYDIDHTLSCGVALIDAGIHWNRPDWTQAGQSTLINTITAAMNPRYNMFYESMHVIPGQGQTIENYQAQAATQSIAADTFVQAYNLTHNTFYLTMAGNLLRTLLNGPLWDQTYGGLFFALDTNTGYMHQDYKETRAQTITLIALHDYNKTLSQNGSPLQFLDKQQTLSNLLTYNFYQSTYHGFFYRVTPNFQIYTTHPGQGIGYEDFFTTEAMGLAMDALQQTEFSYALPLARFHSVPVPDLTTQKVLPTAHHH